MCVCACLYWGRKKKGGSRKTQGIRQPPTQNATHLRPHRRAPALVLLAKHNLQILALERHSVGDALLHNVRQSILLCIVGRPNLAHLMLAHRALPQVVGKPIVINETIGRAGQIVEQRPGILIRQRDAQPADALVKLSLVELPVPLPVHRDERGLDLVFLVLQRTHNALTQQCGIALLRGLIAPR